MGAPLRFASLLVLLWAVAPPPVGPLRAALGQSRPMPDERAFFVETQENLARAQREQYRFAYKERRTELHMNPFGRVGTGATRAFEVIPVDGGAVITRRLIEDGGKPVIDGPVERIDRRDRQRDRGARRSGVEDAAAMLEFTMERREKLHGRDVIVVSFSPRRDGRPETREGRLARVFKGSIWVDEAAREVIRVEATAVDDISFGLGVVVRIGKGATAALTREPVTETIWLPTSIQFMGRGRALLFRRLTVDHAIEWFDYRQVVD